MKRSGFSKIGIQKIGTKKRGWIISLLMLLLLLVCSGCGSGDTVAAMELPTQAAEAVNVVIEDTAGAASPVAAETAQTAPIVEQERVQQVGKKQISIEYAAPLAYVLEYPSFADEKMDSLVLAFLEERKTAFAEKYDITDEKAKKWLSQKDCKSFLYLTYDSYLVEEDKICIVFHEKGEFIGTNKETEGIFTLHIDQLTGERLTEQALMKEGFLEAVSAYVIEYFTTEEPYKHHIFGDYETVLASTGGQFQRFALTDTGVLFYFDRYTVFPGSMGVVELRIPYEALAGLLNGAGAEAPPVVEEEPPAVTPMTPVEREIDPEKPMVALTFDDGPNPKHTGRILDILEQHKAVATFFDLGSLVDAYPETVQREAALGCEVASHSYSHKNFVQLTAAEIANDVHLTAAAFEKAVGFAPTLFRPPYGSTNDFVKANMPLAMVTWSVDTLDWKSKSPKAIMQVIRDEGDLDGKVILMHGIYETSATATEQLVPYLLERGYQLVTVSELLQYKHGIEPQSGSFYGYTYFR